jgi:hypothetical protein
LGSTPGRWRRISGDRPDLGLPATAPGTRFLADNDPARDARLNPAKTVTERLRRLAGRAPHAPWRGTVGFAAITEAWNSAVYAHRHGVSGAMVVFGGGHNDYFGSDVHAFDLATREWRCLSHGYVDGPPSAYGAGAVYPTSVYPDNSPLPPHTYDYVQYDDQANNLILLKGQTELGPNVKAAPIPHLFNLDTLSWQHGPRHPFAILNAGGFSSWDAKRRLLWGHSGDDGGGNAFVAYCPDGTNTDGSVGSWREFHSNKMAGRANHNTIQYEPCADLLVFAVHACNALATINPEHPEQPLASLESKGDRPRLSPYAALEYAPRAGKLVYYSALDGPSMYAIDIRDEAHWQKIAAADSVDPITDAAAQSEFPVNLSHTFGRFRIASFAELELAVLVRHVDSSVFAMRLPETGQHRT